MAFHLVGVDLGGTKIATALTDTDSEIVKYETVPIDMHAEAASVIEAMVASIRRVCAEVRPESILGVGVAIAGLVEPGSGRVMFSPNLNWHDVPLGETLARSLKWPVYVANDVNLTALGELHYGAARGRSHVVAVHVGTGIGAGLIFNGQLYQGASGLAGELGQMSVQWNGVRCASGNQGCVEAYASGAAMIRRAQEAIAQGRDSRLKTMQPDLSELSVECIAEAEAAGDKLAHEIISDAGEILGTAVANVINLLNPELVVIGGGVIRGVPQLMELIQEAVSRRALSASGQRCKVIRAVHGREAGVIGATVFAKLAGQPEKSHR